jgi:hypothetical protein
MYRHHFVEAERSPGQVCRSVYLEDPAIFILIYAKWQLVLVKIFCDLHPDAGRFRPGLVLLDAPTEAVQSVEGE